MSPERNLALEEALLDGAAEALHLWESAVYCVVLGRSSRAEREVHLEACAEAGVPVLRRCSGGGAVLLGPGCLNYAMALNLSRRHELESVPESYQALQGWIAEALGIAALDVRGGDILLSDRKVSGSAQRRLRGRLLHHGTLLCGMDLGLVGRFLKEPEREPPHRRGRPHAEFLTRLPLSREQAARRLARALETHVNPHAGD